MRSVLCAVWISVAATGVLASEPTPPVAAAETSPPASEVAARSTLLALRAGPGGPPLAAPRPEAEVGTAVAAAAPARSPIERPADEDQRGSLAAAAVLLMMVIVYRRRSRI